MKWTARFALILLALGVALTATMALGEKPPSREFLPLGLRDPMLNPALPLVLVQGGDTAWVNVHATDECPGDPARGGEATGGPDGFETWCFEDGAGDSTSIGPGGEVYRFYPYDRRTLRDDLDSLYWHATTFQAINPGAEAMCMWCGGFNDRCGRWELTTGGYGSFWNQVMQLDLGPVSVAQGCSIQFKTRYSMECDYDYAYLEYYSFRGEYWRTIDQFNGKSGCTGFFQPCLADWNNYPRHDKCLETPWPTPVNYPGTWKGEAQAPRVFPEYPYGGGAGGHDYVIVPGDSISVTPGNTVIRLRWRVLSDPSTCTSDGDPYVKSFWIDDVDVRWDTGNYAEDFNLVAEGGLPTTPPWSFPTMDPVYQGWAIRYDLDPPFEGYFLPSPGDSGIPSACLVNASWQWSIAPTSGGLPQPDPESRLPGYHIFVNTPAIPLNYGDGEAGPFASPGVVYQSDQYMNILESTCDYANTLVRVHTSTAPPPYTDGGWCEWVDIDGVYLFGGGTFWNIDANEDVAAWSTGAGLDSVQYAFVSVDAGYVGASCWEPTLPPHLDTQYVFDNLSVGIYDGSATTFSVDVRTGRFQDSFNLHTCMHTSNVANSDIRYDRYLLHDGQESLAVTVIDPDGLTGGNVQLRYSTDGGSSWHPPIAMHLSVPDPVDPSYGGEWRTTICDTPWAPGTEILYYVYAQDDSGRAAYYPVQSDPGHEDYPLYFEVSILPTAGAKILLVDDFGRNRFDYHPCRRETTIEAVEDFYELVLQDLGYGYMEAGGYDKYDVQAASSNQRINEPWGFWAADPDSPDVGERKYDIVVWTTGPYFDSNTIQDTTQTFLKQFAFNGGHIWMTGDRIGQDLNDAETAVDDEFYPFILGAEFLGTHPSAFLDSDRFPKIPVGGTNTYLNPGDSLHMYSGCAILRQPMDKITVLTIQPGDPAWTHPGAYLIYEDQTAPYDSVAGIYNFITFGPDTGRIIYTPFSLESIVDSCTVACDPPPGTAGGHITGDLGFGIFRGRSDLVADVLRFFGEDPTLPTAHVPQGTKTLYENALYAAEPNPFNPETHLRFSLAARGQVNIVVYDVLGRQVRTLMDEVLEAGRHSLRWNGRNDAGHLVASGLYFARMETMGFTATQKMTLLK